MSRSACPVPQIDLAHIERAVGRQGFEAVGAVPLRILSIAALQAVARWAAAEVDSLAKRGLREEADEAREIGVQARIELTERANSGGCHDRFRLENENAQGILAVRHPHPQGERWSAGVVAVGERGLGALCWADTREEAEKRATIVRDALNTLAVIP